MFKNFLYIFITIFITFFNINVVKAENCANIEEKITLYNTYTKSLEKLDCNDTSNSENVVICNNYNTNRNMIITELMKQNEQNNICSNQKKEVEQIIKENKSRCGKIFDNDFSNFVNKFMTIFYILGPILLIFFGSLDYAKAVVSSDAESMKKANKNFARRLAATILLFLSPAIVNIIIGINVTDKYLSGNAYSCDFDYLVYTKQYSIKYVPVKNKGGNKLNLKVGQTSTILEAADLYHQKLVNEKWTYSLGGDLKWNDIKSSTYNKNKVTCCATYVNSVLYLAGIFTEEELNKEHPNYNGATSTYKFLKSKGWIEITNYDDLQAGDIVFLYADRGHVQIYAGNGLWYNAGATKYIQDSDGIISPYLSYPKDVFSGAMRYPK